MNHISGTVVLKYSCFSSPHLKYASAFTVHHKDDGESEKAKEEWRDGKEKLTEMQHKLKCTWKKLLRIYCLKKDTETTSHSAI